MTAGHRIAAGVGLGGIAHLWFGFLGSTSGGNPLWALPQFAVGLGLLVAAAGVAGMHFGHGRGLAMFSGGLLVAAAAQALDATESIAGPSLYKVGTLLILVGLAQGAYVAFLARLDGGAAPRRSAQLRLSLAVMAAGMASYLFLNVVQDFPTPYMLGTILGTVGYGLAARGFALPPGPPEPGSGD